MNQRHLWAGPSVVLITEREEVLLPKFPTRKRTVLGIQMFEPGHASNCTFFRSKLRLFHLSKGD